MDASTAIKKFGLEQAFKYVYKDPEKNLLKMMDWADKFAGPDHWPVTACSWKAALRAFGST